MSGPATEDRTPTCPVCGAGLTERDGGGWRCPVCAGAWLAAPGRPGPLAEGGRREEGLAPTPESPSPEGGARLRCIPEEIDFGVVRAGAPRERTLRIESTGASPLSGELTVVDPFGVFRVSATTFAATPAEVRVTANADGLNPGAKRETCVCVRAGELKADVRALLEVGQPWPALLRSPRVLAAGAFVLVLFVLGSVYLPGWLAERAAAPTVPLAASKPQPPVVPTPPPGPPVPQRDPTGTVEWAGMTTVAEAEAGQRAFRTRFRADEGPLRYSVSLSNVRPGVQFEMVWYRGGQTIGGPPVFAADRSNPKGWSTYSGELVPGDYEVRLLANGSVKHRAAFEVVAAPPKPDERRYDPCPEDQVAWAAAQRKDTVSAYREYLSACWPAQHATEAKARKSALAEEAKSADLIRAVQAALNEFGEKGVTVDGRLGPETRAAIRRFQSGKHYRGRFVDEQVSEQLLEDIQRAIAGQRRPTVPTPEPDGPRGGTEFGPPDGPGGRPPVPEKRYSVPEERRFDSPQKQKDPPGEGPTLPRDQVQCRGPGGVKVMSRDDCRRVRGDPIE